MFAQMWSIWSSSMFPCCCCWWCLHFSPCFSVPVRKCQPSPVYTLGDKNSSWVFCLPLPNDTSWCLLFSFLKASASPLRAAGANPKAADKPGLYLYLIKKAPACKNSHVYLHRPTLFLIFPSLHPAESTPTTYISFRRILKIRGPCSQSSNLKRSQL